jgi:hypothetical protein
MRTIDSIIYLLCIGDALAGYFFLTLPLSLIVIGFCALFAAWSLFAPDNSAKIVLWLGGMSWSMEDFVRGWLITGRTGSGKTQCAINRITYQVFQNVLHWRASASIKKAFIGKSL